MHMYAHLIPAVRWLNCEMRITCFVENVQAYNAVERRPGTGTHFINEKISHVLGYSTESMNGLH